jgi:Protein of unknown function (DUF1569)
VLALTAMTTTSVDDAIGRNREALARFMAVVTSLSRVEWEQPVAPGKWSPGQIAEHLALTYEVARQVLHGTSSIRALPAFFRPLARFVLRRAVKKGKFPRGGRAVKGFIPGEGPGDRDVILQRLTAAVDMFVRDYEAASRAGRTTFQHPAFGNLSLRDYALFNDLHTRHHTAQIPARAVS